jgi:hypothetical protein
VEPRPFFRKEAAAFVSMKKTPQGDLAMGFRIITLSTTQKRDRYDRSEMGRKNRSMSQKRDPGDQLYQIEREGIDGVTLRRSGSKGRCPEPYHALFPNKDGRYAALVDICSNRMDFVSIPHLSKFPTRGALNFFIDERSTSPSARASPTRYGTPVRARMIIRRIREGSEGSTETLRQEKLFREFSRRRESMGSSAILS